MLFGDAGRTIKKLSIGAFCFFAIILIIGTIYSISVEEGFLAVLFLVLLAVAFLFCLFLYAFGQLVSDTYSIKQLTNLSLECQIKQLQNEEDQKLFYQALDNLKDNETIDL